ncbi:MAG: hypothetical protein WB524_20185 [Acidobacteriaceae bacterium]
MNPVEWLKAIYGFAGAEHPKASLIVVIVLSAFLGGAIWRFAGYMYVKDHAAVPQSVAPTTINTTNGSQSPILPGNDGVVAIGSDGAGKPKQPPPKEKSQ